MTRIAIVVFVLSGCIEAAQPDVGEPIGELCDNTDSDPATPVSYATDIRAGILVDRGHCVRCHTPDGATPIGVSIAMFDISTYQTLRQGGRTSGTNVIVPGDPCGSILPKKVGPAPPFGSRMPFDGPPYLDDIDQQLIHDWIAEGALEN